MSLRRLKIKQMPKAIGFRLTLWYSSIFIISSLILFGIAYILLTSAIQDDNRANIEDELNEYALVHQTEGWKGLVDKIKIEQAKGPSSTFFVRVADAKNHTLLLNIPKPYKNFDLTTLDNKKISNENGWMFTRFQEDGESNVLEIAYRRFADGLILQIGRGSDAREDLLEQFRMIFAGIIVSTIMTSLIGGGFLAFRTMRPIRDLIDTVKTISEGNMDARVPSSNTGDELDELIKLFNYMLEKIRTLVNGMREALDNVAHDLRTPITRIRAVTETALGANEGGEKLLREALMDCAEESERISTMLNTLMDISEAETGAMRLKFERVDIGRLIKDMAELYQYVGETKKISVSVDAPDGLMADIDPGRFRQVMANLLDNAIKYTKEGGAVNINANKVDGEMAVSIKDTGIGIAPSDLPRIFDRLFRGDKSRSQRGLGLGLSLVKAVIYAHKGRIKVESTPGNGSNFLIVIPISH
ncbi:MAG: HAMP domain-containing sensor histidine kinase [Desulfobacteraceae bacterium]|nr:HAMP domain-containing sensor histidine kinase [Desulfobacteraceae bacterium]